MNDSPNPLTVRIAEAIRRSPRRAIPFRDYMNLALYEPEWGYYMRSRPKIGRDGDFYTSANIGGVMGEMIAREALKLSASGEPLRIAEWGGGTGAMALSVLEAIARLSPGKLGGTTYTLVESSPYHRRLQRQTLQPYAPMVRIWTPEQWREEAPHRFELVFANELLDAFPVHRVVRRGGVWLESYVALAEGAPGTGDFAERWLEPTAAAAEAFETWSANDVPEGKIVELCPDACGWIAMMGRTLSDGTLLLLDYGDERRELLADHRMQGTLAVYSRHRRLDDWWNAPGERDLTAHVDFTAVRGAAEAAGFAVEQYATQKEFLLQAGVFDLLRNTASADPFHPDTRRNRAVRQLLLSDGMSELFKVLRLRRRAD